MICLAYIMLKFGSINKGVVGTPTFFFYQIQNDVIQLLYSNRLNFIMLITLFKMQQKISFLSF